MSEESTFTKRLKRYSSVSLTAGKIGARLAKAKFSKNGLDDAAFAEELVAWIGNLKGPLVKIGQVLALIPDFLPEAYAHQLMNLQSQAPPMGALFVKRRMRGELGSDWQSHFQSFDLKAHAAASLGQVHRAVSLAGVPLACKLQYPDMQAAIEADINQLKLFLSLFDRFDKAIKHEKVIEEISTYLFQELDYTQEFNNLSMMQQIFEGDPDIRVPTPQAACSTRRLLTMTWENGQSLMAANLAESPQRHEIARKLFKAFYHPLYHYGMIHADPHTGNFLITPDYNLVLLDFGCVRTFEANHVGAIIALYKSFLNNTPQAREAAYHALGFESLTPPLKEALDLWAGYLFNPLIDDRVRPLEEGFSSTKGRAVAEEVHTRLKEAGGIRPPREFVFIDRVAVVLGSVFMHLRAELNWHQLFEEIIASFSPDQLTQNQSRLAASIRDMPPAK